MTNAAVVQAKAAAEWANQYALTAETRVASAAKWGRKNAWHAVAAGEAPGAAEVAPLYMPGAIAHAGGPKPPAKWRYAPTAQTW